ncbi:universal stress protein [Natronolimnohabitans sp. A-GB9]|uniref:universal stress protein n=1 Tax=Natronolimnohabitans sp. A-GB9 TaxID=3069757 RepID=UPI0027B55488|nr:universal stress protein [Natronolimnohabitans sp. A-GB9]MDQ2052409.1 universal stress protein [Natronolimnohabitans sp. A-GB9]
MTFVVPFDGSTLAQAALARAVEYSVALEEDVTAVSVIPERKKYAREKGWIADDEPYDVDAVVDALREQVRSLAPDASYEYERIREFPPEARLANRIEELVVEQEPSVVFLGSDNVGRVVTPLTSVGVHLADEESYDVFIVRDPSPPKLEALDPHETFYDADDSG